MKSFLRGILPDLIFLAIIGAAATIVLTAKGYDLQQPIPYVTSVPRAGEIARDLVFVGNVERVTDGDTLWVSQKGTVTHKVRLYAVDAPELDHAFFGKKWPEQPYAKEARDVLKSLVIGNTVTCTVVNKSYDRYVCKVFVGNKDVCLEMVKLGAAWVEPRYNHSQAYRDAQDAAESAKLGLHSDRYKPAVEPRFWRAGKR